MELLWQIPLLIFCVLLLVSAVAVLVAVWSKYVMIPIYDWIFKTPK